MNPEEFGHRIYSKDFEVIVGQKFDLIFMYVLFMKICLASDIDALRDRCTAAETA